MAGDRARADEYAERVNAAADLADAGMPAAEAARSLAGRFGCSVRQARRYVERAARSGRVVASQATTVFTVSCRPAGSRVREHARRRGSPSPLWRRRRWRSSWRAAQRPSAQVSSRAVETQFVFGRHAAAELSVAYAIWCRSGRAASAAGRTMPMTSAAIYARVSSARQKKDQTIGSQTAALREHAAQQRA